MAIKVAIIGGGLIAPRHAKAINLNPSAILIALVEPSSKGPEIAAKFNTYLYSSVGDLLTNKNTKPDAAIVCTPNHTHVPIARELLAAPRCALRFSHCRNRIVTGSRRSARDGSAASCYL